MNKIAEGIVIFLLILNIKNIGVGIGVVTLTIFLGTSGKHHRIHLFLPILLMQRLYLLIFIVKIILVLDLHFHSIVVVNSLRVLLIVHKTNLASIASLLPS